MKNIFTLCFFLLFSAQTHGAGKWRERFSRFLPFIAPKAYKLEKLEQKEKAKTKQRVASMDDLGLMVLDLELRNNTYNIEILEEMAALAREEIYRRIGGNEQAKILDMMAPSLKAWLGSILSNPKTASHFFEIFQDAAQGDLPERYRGILQEFLSANNKDIMALNPNPKQLQGMIKATHSIDASIKILQEALDSGKNADDFFAAFNTVTWPSPSGEYQEALDKFFTDNAEAIEKLPFSAEQAKYIRYYIYRATTAIVFLEGALKQAQGDANKFFAIFKAVTAMSPNKLFQKTLNQFFVNNTEVIGKLPFSTEQTKYIGNYVYYIPTYIMLLKGGLKRANGNAERFFAIFKGVTDLSNLGYDSHYREALNKFFTDNAEEVGKLPFTAEQAKYIGEKIHYTSTYIMLLKGGLKRANGNADRFFATFKAVTDISNPGDDYRKALNKFFKNNAEAIEKLPFSTEQTKYIGNYLHYIPTYIMLLKGGLKRANGNAERFFAIFKGVTDIPDLGDEYKNDLNHFFTDNAEEIEKLHFSPYQARHIASKILRIKTAILLMQAGLKQTQENADRFFAIFNAVTAVDHSPNKAYRDALNSFFADNAEKIMNLGPSLEQIKELNNYIGRSSTSIKILELTLARAEYAGDFFNVFHIIAENSPENSQHIYGHFLTDHANAIVDLGPSPDQMEKISKYVSSPEILFDMAKNQKKKQRAKKKREVCSANTAILLSLGHFPENTE